MQTLQQGSNGADVIAWQTFLNSQGLNVGTVDGDFGPATEAETQQFQNANGLTADGIVGPDTLAAAVAAGFALPAPVSFPGFDVASYPGDAAMQDWKNNSPYVWCGYYFVAPCHTTTFAPFSGKRATLVGQGWNVVAIYVGQQQADANVCGQNVLTAAQAAADGADAAGKAALDGFPNGSMIFLDVEPVDVVSDGLSTYVSGFSSALIADARYLPGVYCHRKNAAVLMPLVANAYPAGGTQQPRFWITGGPNATGLNHVPSESGITQATMWQMPPLDVNATFGATQMNQIDNNVSLIGDPSSPQI